MKLDLDITCLTETHAWRECDPSTVYSDAPGKNDKYSGTALIINKRLTKYITTSGSIGSRIVYCRLRGLTCNLFVIGVDIPQKKRSNPDQNATYDELEKLLFNINTRDCIILMGDFNSRLARNVEGSVGRSNIHTRSDNGGDRLLSIMNKIDLRCVTTYFQPRRNHNNASFINIQPNVAPSQIDHVLISSRWSSSVRNCKMKWGIAFEAYGRKYDHALVQFKFKIRLRCERKSARKDFSALKSPTIQRAHESCIEESFRSNPRPSSPCDQWGRLTNTLQKAQSTLPSKRELGTKKWETSEETLQLVKQRSQNWSRIDNDEKKSLTKAISR